MDEFGFDSDARSLGKRKVVFREGDEKRVRTIIGDVYIDGDFIIIDTGQTDDLWLHRDAVIAIKTVVR